MNEPSATRLPAVVALAATALVLMLVGLETTPFRGFYDDVDRALVARNMADHDAWLVATYLGQPLHTKPPLAYWLAGGLYELTGRRDEMPARAVSAACMLVLVLGTAHLGWRLRDLATGLRAGLLLITTHLVLAMARQPLVDTVMLAGLGVALVALAELVAGPVARRPWWWLALAAATGWAIMAKGPVLLPVLALVFGPVVLGRRAVRPAPATAAAMLGLVVLMVLPWHLAMHQHDPSYLAVWRTEILGRFTGSDAFHAWTREPIWFYGPDLVTSGLPWLALAAGGLVLAWRGRRLDLLSRVLLWWALGGVVFFTAASVVKRSYYLLPLYPALALAAADLWRAHRNRDLEPRFPRRVFGVARVITEVTVGLLAAALTAAVMQGWLGWPWLALLIAVVIAGWRLDPSRRGVVPGLDTQIAMAAVILLAYHGSVVPRLNAFLSGKAFYVEAREVLDRSDPAPLMLSEVHLALADFYLDRPQRFRTEAYHEVQPANLPDRIDDHGRGWLVCPPDVAAGVRHVEPVLVRTWSSPFTLETRSLGLYRFGPGSGRPDDGATAPPSPERQEVPDE